MHDEVARMLCVQLVEEGGRRADGARRSWEVAGGHASCVRPKAPSNFSTSSSHTSSAARASAESPAAASSCSWRVATLSRTAKICWTAPLTECAMPPTDFQFQLECAPF